MAVRAAEGSHILPISKRPKLEAASWQSSQDDRQDFTAAQNIYQAGEHKNELDGDGQGCHSYNVTYSPSEWANPKQLFSSSYRDTLRAAFAGETKSGKDRISDASVERMPFPSLQLYNVLSPALLQEARTELMSCVNYKKKANDLYSYRGSGDLSDKSLLAPGSQLERLRNALYSVEFTELVTSVTGVKLLSGRPDLSSHQYLDGDYLLAHDDDVRSEMESENEGRRIAFILYLVDAKNWSEEDGGSLDLFECNSLGHPTTIRHRIFPRFNSIALFEVTPTSYHTVAEVTLPPARAVKLSPPCRLSISGWFHGPVSSRLALPLSLPISTMAGQAEDFVNPTYLDKAIQKTIEASLISDSSIELRGFLKADVWEQLCQERILATPALSPSKAIGPAHLRNYYELEDSRIIDSITSFMRSPNFIELLSAFTSLNLISNGTPARVQGRIFKQGCYTLLHDQGHDPDGIDVVLGLGTMSLSTDGKTAAKDSKGKEKAKEFPSAYQLNSEEMQEFDEIGWVSKWGGQICFCPNDLAQHSPSPSLNAEKAGNDGESMDEAASTSDDGSLRILPRPNTLSIVVRNLHTLKFVKYVSNRARHPVNQCPLARLDIEGVYQVDLDDDEDDEDEEELAENESKDEATMLGLDVEPDVGEDDEDDGAEESEDAEDEDETTSNDGHKEWQGLAGRKTESIEPDGPDELED